ncbi:MAG: hypothetical protein ABI640_13200 [Gammaproteobacteria bacterium]
MITEAKPTAVCAELEAGASYRKARKLVGVNVKVLRRAHDHVAT